MDESQSDVIPATAVYLGHAFHATFSLRYTFKLSSILIGRFLSQALR